MQLGNNEFNERSDIDLFHSGEHYHAYNYMGAHKEHRDGVDGVMFRTWAPHAKSVSIVGTFNNWDRNAHPMNWTSDGGIWECFIADIVGDYSIYKYSIETYDGSRVMKSDPYAYHYETRPNTASVYVDIDGPIPVPVPKCTYGSVFVLSDERIVQIELG